MSRLLTLLRRKGDSALFRDTFTDTDGVRLNAHTPDHNPAGGGWTEHTATWTVSDGKVSRSGSGAAVASVDVGQTEYTVTCDVFNAADAVAVRAIDSQNCFFVFLSASTIEIYEAAASNGVVRASTSVAVTFPAALTVVVTNAGITGHYSGASVTYASTDKNTASRVGFRRFGGSTEGWDNLMVVP